MEELFDRVSAHADHGGEIEVLREYYESGLWREDFEADEQGKLPRLMKRGVLSEDGLWNLLESDSK
ncbi:MAG: DUF4298 domain-containing protein [Bacteroidota bacterium]|nr:DUF4298 domain-containing protein [Bacteroidota bacterium]